jgi:Icc protein
MDECMLTNSNELLNVVSKYNNIKIVAFGHIHQEFSTKISEVSFFGTPSTCIQFKPNQDLFTIDTTVTPGYREFILDNDGSFNTKIYRIDKSHIE